MQKSAKKCKKVQKNKMLKLNLIFLLLFVFNLSYAQLDVLKNTSSKDNSFINAKKTLSDKDISNGLTEALKISVIKSCNNCLLYTSPSPRD